MTADMAFECVLISRDPGVVCSMNRALEKFSIDTNVCFIPSRTSEHLADGNADLVIIDYDATTEDLLQDIYKVQRRQKPTVVAVSGSDGSIPGAHLTIRKPLSNDSCVQSVRNAYTRMLIDYRRHTRHSVLIPLRARDQYGRFYSLTIMDIGDGGVGFMSTELPSLGSILSFDLMLPDAKRSILIEAKVLWTRHARIGGCEFVRIAPLDVGTLHDWLKSKCRVKQPLVEI